MQIRYVLISNKLLNIWPDGAFDTVLGSNDMKDNEGPANVEEGVSVHVEEDGEDLTVWEAAQFSWIQVTRGNPTGVTLKRLNLSKHERHVHFYGPS